MALPDTRLGMFVHILLVDSLHLLESLMELYTVMLQEVKAGQVLCMK